MRSGLMNVFAGPSLPVGGVGAVCGAERIADGGWGGWEARIIGGVGKAMLPKGGGGSFATKDCGGGCCCCWCIIG